MRQSSDFKIRDLELQLSNDTMSKELQVWQRECESLRGKLHSLGQDSTIVTDLQLQLTVATKKLQEAKQELTKILNANQQLRQECDGKTRQLQDFQQLKQDDLRTTVIVKALNRIELIESRLIL